MRLLGIAPSSSYTWLPVSGTWQPPWGPQPNSWRNSQRKEETRVALRWEIRRGMRLGLTLRMNTDCGRAVSLK
jgi:hypothetical protein